MASEFKKLSIFTTVLSVIYGILFLFFRYIYLPDKYSHTDMQRVNVDLLILLTIIGWAVLVILITLSVAFHLAAEKFNVCLDNEEVAQLKKEVSTLKQQISQLSEECEKVKRLG